MKYQTNNSNILNICKKIFIINTVVFSFLFLLTSCEPDDFNDDSSISPRDKFVGTWTCIESSQLTYNVNIRKSSYDSSIVNIYHFHYLGETEYAIGEVAGYTLTIPEQDMCEGSRRVKGNGIMTSNQQSITLNYTISDGIVIDTINATYSR